VATSSAGFGSVLLQLYAKYLLLEEGLGWALIAVFYFADVVKRHSSNLFMPPVLLFQMGITGQDSVKSASALLNRKELQ